MLNRPDVSWIRGGWRRLAAAWGVALFLVAVHADAQVQRAFTARYSTNTTGDIAQIGNNSQTCSTVTGANAGICDAARNDTPSASLATDDNGSFDMINANADPNAVALGLTNSSSADLALPVGSTVLWAGLYWGARETGAGTPGTILFRTPAMGGYTAVNALQLDNGVLANNIYGAFADVTNLVQSAGNGTFWTANIDAFQAASDGLGSWAGWSLVVVYSNNTLPLRNLVVYDGLVRITGTGANGVTLNIAGFLTPFSGTVSTRVGAIGYDGDRNLVGDNLAVSSSSNPAFTSVTDASNPATNFFNSTIGDFGVLNFARNPSWNNTMGMDIDRFNLTPGIVGNGATSALVRLETGGEVYVPHAITWATDIYVPIITPNVLKTLTDVNGGSLTPGDTIRWNISMSNTGIDAGTFLTVTDAIPANTSYVSGSLRVTATPAGAPAAPAVGTYTDAAGDDAAEYLTTAPACSPAAAPCIRFRLGHGATPAIGGTLNFGEATAFSFDTIVNDGLSGRPAAPPSGTQISNTAQVSYSGQTIQTQFGTSSSAATANVLGPPSVTKTFSPSAIPLGGTSTLTLVLSNPAANPATLNGVVIADTYPTGMVNTAAGSAVVCTAGSTPGTITGGISGGNTIGMNPGATIAPNGSCTITVTVTHDGSVTGPANLSNLTNPVTSANGGTGTSGAAVLAVAQMSIVKAFNPGVIQAATMSPPVTPVSTLSIAISNPTAALVNQVKLTDTYPAGLVNASLPGIVFSGCGAATSGAITAAAGAGSMSITGNSVTIAANSTCTISLNVGSTVTTGASIYNNQTGGAVYQGNATPGNGSNTAQLTVVGPATVTKSFSPVSISSAGLATLSIVVANPNPTTTLTGGALADPYTGTLTTSGAPNRTINCTAGSSATATNTGTSLSLSAMTLAPGGSCTVTIVVTATSSNTNTATATWANAPTSSGTGTLNVSALAVPTMTKAFSPATIPVGGVSTMTFVITNSNASAVTGVNFTDTYPGATSATLPNTSITGTCTAGGFNGVTAGSIVSAFSLSGLTLPASGSCTINVPGVTTTTVGAHLNTTSQLGTSNAGVGVAANATLTAVVPPVLAKAFLASPVALSTPVTMSITVSNPAFNAATLTGVTFVDSYPANLVNSAAPGTSISCTAGSALAGTLTAVASGTQVAVGGAGLTLAVNGNCVITLLVQTAVAGTYANTIDNGAGTGAAGVRVNSTNGGSGNVTTATLTAGLVGISKAFLPATINTGSTSTVTLTLTNSQAGAVSPISFTDTFPAGMTLASPTVGGTCTGVTTAPVAATGASGITVNAGSVPGSGNCTITFSVIATVAGANLNTTGGVTGGGGTGAPSNTAVLQVQPAPAVSKAFSPSVMAQGGVSTMTLTVLNSSVTAASGGALVDSYPAGMVNANPSNIATTCDGVPFAAAPVLTATPGAASFSATSLYFPGNSSCIITVRVTAAAAGAYTNTIPAGGLTSSNGANGTAASATLTTLLPPLVSKVFIPAAVGVGASSTLVISLTNPNATAISGAGFTDTYPASAGIYVNATPANGATICAGGSVTAANGGASVTLAGGTIAANGTCTVTVNVTASATPGAYGNTIGAGGVTTANAGSNAAAASSTLTVGRLSVTKTFSPNPVQLNGTSTLTFVITNPTGGIVTGTGLVDNLPAAPAQMRVATAGTGVGTSSVCGGINNLVAPALGTSITLTAATVPANGTCSFAVLVAAGTNPGSYVNLSNAITSSIGTGSTATDTLTAMAAPTVAKSFSPAQVGVGSPAVLTITLTNPNAFAITGGAFTDSYPSANLTNTATPAGTTTCSGGSVTAANGSGSVALSGGTIPANGSCVVTVNVQASTSGAYVNNTGAVTSSNAPAAASASGTLTVLAPLRVVKSFAPNPVNVGTASVMTISLQNPNAVAVTGVALTDVYPAGMVNTGTPAAAASAGCTGIMTGVANDNQLSYTGSVNASATCTLTVNTTSNTGGVFLNNTGVTVTGNAGSTASTSGTLVVNPPAATNSPVIGTKSFSPSTISVGGVATMTISVFNPNSVAATSAAAVFTDTYPAGILNTATAGGFVTGVGCVVSSITAAANGNSFAVNGTAGVNFVIPAGGTCVYTRPVTATASGTATNSTGNFTLATPGANGTAATGQLTALAPPTIAKAFAPTSVAGANTLSTMTITLSNPNGAAITGVSLTDNYPANLRNRAVPNVVNGCAGAVSSGSNALALALTGGTIPGSGSCTISVDVESTVNNVNLNNTVATSGVTTANTGSPLSPASATLTVGAAVPPVSITKTFLTNPVQVNTATQMRITITKNQAGTAVAAITLTDIFPAGMVVDAAPGIVWNGTCNGATVAAVRNLANAAASAANDTGLTLTTTGGGVLPNFLAGDAAGTTCQLRISVRATSPGVFANSAGPVSGSTGTGNSATANLNVLVPPAIAKAFSPATVSVGQTSVLTFTVTNSDPSPITNTQFADTMPASIVIDSPASVINNCNGTLTAVPGTSLISLASVVLAGGSLATPTSCTISVNVQATNSGTFNNLTGVIQATNSNAAVTVTGNTTNATLTVTPVPPSAVQIAKSFTPSSITAGGVSTMSFILSNLNTTAATAGAGVVLFSDPMTSIRVSTGGVTVNGCANSNVQGTLDGTTWSGGPPNGSIGVRLTGTGGGTVVPGRVGVTPGTCQIDVQVTSDTPGTLPNSTSGVTANVGATVTGNPSNIANLTVGAAAPTIVKTFLTASIPVGGVSTMRFTISNPNSIPLTGMSFTDGLTNMQLASPPNVGGTCTGVSTTATAGATSFTVTTGNLSASGVCTIQVDVTSTSISSGPGWPNFASGVTTTQTPVAGSQSNTAYLKVFSAGVPVSGAVYVDSNDNGVLDSGAPGETWATGVSVFVNLVGTGGVVVQSVALAPGPGAFTFNNVNPGTYQIVVTNSAINAVAVAPTAWYFRSPASGGYATVTVGLVASTNWNLGLRAGATISGKVFRDTGGGSATANNGVLEATEAPANPQLGFNPGQGIAGVTVRLTDCNAVTYATTTTDVSGDYRFAVPVTGTPLCVVETNPSGYLSTGGSAAAVQLISAIPTVAAGTTYTYCRTAATSGACTGAGITAPDSISFTAAANTSYLSLNFGDVPVNTFVANGTKRGPPGEVVFYPHIFTPGSVGSVTFTIARVSTPAWPGWGEVMYRDLNCDGTLGAAEVATVIAANGQAGSAVLADPNDTTPGDPSGRRICVILRESIPPNAPFNAENQATITATFAYSNSLPALSTTLNLIDTTATGSATGGDGLRLQKTVCNVTNPVVNPGGAACNAATGAGFGTANSAGVNDELQYMISYTNASSERLTNLSVSDSTPPFTVRSALAAPAYGLTPAGLTNGTVVDPLAGNAGAFSWPFTGFLNPQSSGYVTFNVTVQ